MKNYRFCLMWFASFFAFCISTAVAAEEAAGREMGASAVVRVAADGSTPLEDHAGMEPVALKGVWGRIAKSNNRALGTLFGCITGGIVATILVTTDATASFQIFGDPLSTSTIYKVGGILLSAGVGGNLSSYIGASIDIITDEKTIFDLIRHFASR